MSVHFEAARPTRPWLVRWREGGAQRTKRFATEADAVAFNADRSRAAPVLSDRARSHRRRTLRRPLKLRPLGRRDGVYAYSTRSGTRYRFAFRQADGRLSNRRGFTSRATARRAKRELEEGIRRGEAKASRDSFADLWERFLLQRRPYLSPGSFADYEAHGRKRLLPFFAARKLTAIDEDFVRDWLAGMVELVEAGELAPKTVNNALTALSVALNDAAQQGLLAGNPCSRVRHLPIAQTEKDYLRLHEIRPYLDAAPGYYRPLAEFLIGSGVRISEAVALRWEDLDLQDGLVRIVR